MGRYIYYTLRLHGNTGFYKSGDEFSASTEPMLIGENPDCNIRFSSSDEGAASEYYAAILPNDDDTWRLVPMSQQVPTMLSGHGVISHVCTLRDGDRITFGGHSCSLVFRKHHDAAYRDSGRVIVSRADNRTTYTLFAVTLMILCVAAYFLYHSVKQISRSDLEAYETSVYTLQVDSVECVRLVGGIEDEVIWTEDFADGHHELGTAFLADDGRLFTARHCIEYWLGHDPDPQAGIDEIEADELTRLIAEAETYNYFNAESDTTYQIRSYFHVWNEADPEGMKFVSTDPKVSINRNRDDLLVYDDFDSRYYWRSITPHHLRHDMALGDIVTIQTGRKGEIHIASQETLESLKKDTETGLLGYPESGMEQRTLDFAKGSYHKGLSAESGLIATKGEATHGFSGGPVFVADGTSYSVIGVLSKVDPVNPEIKYSVPVIAAQQ